MNIARIARNAALALFLTAGLAACGADPVAPSGDDNGAESGDCVWIEGVLRCKD